MLDLSPLPPELIVPFTIVFALALFVSKIFDIFLKWRTINKNTEGSGDKIKSEAAIPRAEFENTNIASSAHRDLTAKAIFLYAFIGAIALNILSILTQFIFIDAPEYLEGQLFHLVYSALFGLISAVICTFFIRNKFPLIRQNPVVTVLMGLGVSKLLSMPIEIIFTIVQINKAYG